MEGSSTDVINAKYEEIKRRGMIPEKSRKQYYVEYRKYCDWKEKTGIQKDNNTEATVGVYLEEKSKNVVPTSLFTTLSMLKAVLALEENVVINADHLNKILSKKCKGYTPKQSPTFTKKQLSDFLGASDTFLIQKVIVILGMCGALRRQEMYDTNMTDIDMRDNVAIIKIGPSKTATRGTFAIPKDESGYFDVFKKYFDLRKAVEGPKEFLLQVRNNKCTRQRVGINKITETAKEIARYLSIPNFNEYSSHSFRRSSATALVESGVDILTLKRHGRWRSDQVAERYVAESVSHQVSVAKRICTEATAIRTESETINCAASEENKNQEGMLGSNKTFPLQ